MYAVCPADMLLQDICIVELREHCGWITIPLTAPGQADLQSGTLAAERPVHAFFYQVGAQPGVLIWLSISSQMYRHLRLVQLSSAAAHWGHL